MRKVHMRVCLTFLDQIVLPIYLLLDAGERLTKHTRVRKNKYHLLARHFSE